MLQGASTDVQNNNQQTPLHLAVERQNIQVVRVSPAVRLLILLYTYKYLVNEIWNTVMPVFSLAYLRHVGPTSLQYRIPFDVGMG